MASTIVFCGKCKVPLADKNQFLGHHVLSHELRIEEAENAWLKSSQDMYSHWSDGGRPN